jgi:hypothetical protein
MCFHEWKVRPTKDDSSVMVRCRLCDALIRVVAIGNSFHVHVMKMGSFGLSPSDLVHMFSVLMDALLVPSRCRKEVRHKKQASTVAQIELA